MPEAEEEQLESKAWQDALGTVSAILSTYFLILNLYSRYLGSIMAGKVNSRVKSALIVKCIELYNCLVYRDELMKKKKFKKFFVEFKEYIWKAKDEEIEISFHDIRQIVDMYNQMIRATNIDNLMRMERALNIALEKSRRKYGL